MEHVVGGAGERFHSNYGYFNRVSKLLRENELFPLKQIIVIVSIFAFVLVINPIHVYSFFANDQKASYVIGQKDFTSFQPNGGELTANQYSFYWPSGIAFDKEGNLWVADMQDNRVLKYNDNPLIIYVPP